MSYSDELTVLATDTVDMLTDAQAVLYLMTTLGSFNVTTMKNTPTFPAGVDVNCVRGATRVVEVIINGKPTKVKETEWIIKASAVSRAPQENDYFTLGAATHRIIHASVEVAGRQYRCTTRELG